MPKYSIPVTVVWFNAATSRYGFSVSFAGRPPHYTMDVFDSLKNLMAWLNPHGEILFAEPSDADESKLLVSVGYRPGSVLERCA